MLIDGGHFCVFHCFFVWCPEVFIPGEIQHSKFGGCGLIFILFLFYKIEEGIWWQWKWQRTKAKTCAQASPLFRREPAEAEELEIGITHRWVAEGRDRGRGSDWPCVCFEDGCLQWCSVHCRLLFRGQNQGSHPANLGVPGESGDVAGSGSTPG